MTRFISLWSGVLILMLILAFQPIGILHAQEKGRFNLGPQLKPVEDISREHLPFMSPEVSNSP